MWIIWLLAALLLLSGLYLFLIAPGRTDKTELFAMQTLFAHRGLYNNQDIPENSMPAFRKAVGQGYGIELDVHLTKDGALVVFHDDDISRMCGQTGVPEEMTKEQIKLLKLLNTDERIPEFSEVLDCIDGKVPLIVEIKGTTLNTDICKKTAEILDRYKGAYCIESFNPYYVRWFKNNRPDVVRGQLACRMEPGQTLKESVRNFLLENMMFNFLSRPQFLAYCHADCQKLSFRLARQMGGYPVAWTITQPAELSEARADFKAFIFEGFLPEAKK